MIQIYKKSNLDFAKNGDITLSPLSCRLQTKINDVWTMLLSHPLDDDGRWKYIEEEAVICAPTFQGDRQLFRISTVEKTDTEITATAYPIFFDSAKNCFLMDTRPEMKNGQQALNIMTAGTKYSGESDISTGSTAYFVRRNLMDAINGEDDPTFIQRWGGEILYDNFKIIINERVGGEYGTEIRYGKNMNGISYRVDMSEVVTRIVPVAYNGYMLDGNAPWVDSGNINKYAMVYTREMKFENVKLLEDANEDDEKNGLIVCKDLASLRIALRGECKKQFDAGVDLPAVTIEVNMVDLANTEEYKDYKVLETVALGDTVHCRHSKLDITTDARVIELEWDCIRNIPAAIKLGDFEYNYFSELSSALGAVSKIVGPGNTVVAERVNGVLNAINTQLRYQKSIAQRQDVRAILFEDMDKASPTYGAMCLGSQGFQISNKRTQDNRDWNWSTAFTAKGGYADVLVAGLLSDKTGKSFWNLDTGEMQLTGVFRQFAINGYRSVEISNNEAKFYAWNDNGNYVGSVGAVRRNKDGRVGIEMWCDKGDMLWLGYDMGPEHQAEGRIRPIFEFDSNYPDKPPWIVGTVSGTLYIPDGMGWTENSEGFIRNLRYNRQVVITVENGSITGWRTEDM